MAGYHSAEIAKGVLGELSKIKEELAEVEDALFLNNKVMVLLELSDLVGAISFFLEKNHPSIRVEDLIVMAEATKGAFSSGHRK